MVENFVAEVTHLEYLQKEGHMNYNHVFHKNDLQEEKEMQLHSAHRGLSSENLSRDTTFNPGRAKLDLQHDRITLQVKCHYLDEKILLL